MIFTNPPGRGPHPRYLVFKTWKLYPMNHFLDTRKKRVIITGSKEFNDYGLLKRKMEKFTFLFEDVNVCVRQDNKGWDPYDATWTGADFLGEKWAHRKKYLVSVFHLNGTWSKSPEKVKVKAAKERDLEIVQYADYMAVFIEESGNEEVEEFIELARQHNVRIKEVRF